MICNNCPLEYYTKFLNILLTKIPVKDGLLRVFFLLPRDLEEIENLLCLINNFDENSLMTSREEIKSKFLQLYFVKNSNFDSYNEHLDFFKYNISYIDLNDDKEIIYKKFFFNIFSSVLSNQFPFSRFKSVFNFIKENEIELSIVVFNNLLNHLKKLNNSSNLFTKIFNYIYENCENINIVTMNISMDYFSENNMFSNTLELFRNLKYKNLVPDSYTFSTLIKGIRNNNVSLNIAN